MARIIFTREDVESYKHLGEEVAQELSRTEEALLQWANREEEAPDTQPVPNDYQGEADIAKELETLKKCGVSLLVLQKISPAQAVFIASYLQTSNVKASAKVAGVNRVTYYKWCNTTLFMLALYQAKIGLLKGYQF